MGTGVMYRFIIKKPAKKFIDGLPGNERKRLVSAIEKLPDAGDITRLKAKRICSASVSVPTASFTVLIMGGS